MDLQERFESRGFTFEWDYGINWYYAISSDKEYLGNALKTVLGWTDYDCESHMFKHSNVTWAVGFHR